MIDHLSRPRTEAALQCERIAFACIYRSAAMSQHRSAAACSVKQGGRLAKK